MARNSVGKKRSGGALVTIGGLLALLGGATIAGGTGNVYGGHLIWLAFFGGALIFVVCGILLVRSAK